MKRIPPAISGQDGSGTTASLAAKLACRGAGKEEILDHLRAYNERCEPPWSERDLEHKAADALKFVGRSSAASNGTSKQPRLTAPSAKSSAAEKTMHRTSAIASVPLPQPLSDPTHKFLTALFQPGEFIGLELGAIKRDGRCAPIGPGPTKTLESWLEVLQRNGGDAQRIWPKFRDGGAYARVNPMSNGGKGDADVASFRHLLVEADVGSLEEQWALILQSHLPCSAVTTSGGKSIHAIVRVDARSKEEYEQCVQVVYSFAVSIGLKLDPKNKNPSRFTRLPGVLRGSNQQQLLAVNIGAPSFEVWRTQGACREISVESLLKFDSANDPDVVLGNR